MKKDRFEEKDIKGVEAVLWIGRKKTKKGYELTVLQHDDIKTDEGLRRNVLIQLMRIIEELPDTSVNEAINNFPTDTYTTK